LRLAVYQFALAEEPFWPRVEARLASAAHAGADVFVLPEYCGLQLLWPDHRPADGSELMNLASAQAAGYADRMQALAADHGLWIVAGSIPERGSDGRIRNTCVIASPAGALWRQPKCLMTAWERDFGVVGGDELLVFLAGELRFAVAVCYDVEVPELARQAGAAGAELLFVPSFTEAHWGSRRVNRCAAGIAESSQMVVATASLAGSLPLVELDATCARSLILAPSHPGFPEDGCFARAAEDRDELLIADIDLGLLRQVRAGADVNPLRDAAMGARVRCRVITGASDGGPRRSTNMPGARASRGGLDCPQGLFSGGRRRSGSGWV